MIILEYILWYFVIGCLFDLFYMGIEKWLDSKNLLKRSLSNYDRVAVILLWPIGLIFFLHGYITELFRKRD